MAREHVMYETYLAVKETNKRFEEQQQSKIAEKLKESAAIDKLRRDVKEKRISLRDSYDKFNEYALNDLLGSALKGIYISSLGGESALTPNGLALAESMVDDFIKENGSVTILNNMKGKTYLLNTIYEAVEEAHEETMDKVDKENPDTQEVPEEAREKMFDDLENEDDVDTAVDLIAKRISAAEEEFIKKNAEDKDKIETIVKGINDRIEAAKSDNSLYQEKKDAIEHEATIISKKEVNSVRFDRMHTVFEEMSRLLSESIVKDDYLKSQYLEENGKLDMDAIVESVRCLYGFLEFANTIQLENVDQSYIEKVLKEM